MTVYTRIKDKRSGHEYDIPAVQFDPEKHSRVSRYPDSTRPRRPKLRVSKGGGPATTVPTDKE